MIAERLADHLFQDMPAFRLLGEAGRGRLLAAIAQPRWGQYRDLQAKTAVLHYHLNKAHAYADGNKRVALAATELFVAVNRAALVATDEELEELALGVAGNSISQSENAAFFRERILRFTWDDAQRERWGNRLSPEGGQALLSDQTLERFQRLSDSLTEVMAEMEQVIEQRLDPE